MCIIEAIPEDHESLTKLTVESKSYWNYSEEQIKEWLPDLIINPEYIQKNEVYKLLIDGEIVAYYGFYSTEPKEVLLDSMFVSPEFIGEGFGRKMMNDFLARVKSLGFTQIILYSDPNSEDFYSHFGFEVIGQEETSIVDRFLPIMRKNLG